MPNYTINIPSEDANDFVSAFSEGWDESIGITRIQYAKQQVKQYLKSQVLNWRKRQQIANEPNIDIT